MPHHCSVGHLLFRRQLDERRKRSATTNTQSPFFLLLIAQDALVHEQVGSPGESHSLSHYLIETTPSSCPLNNKRHSIDNHSLLSLEQMPATSSTDRYSAVSSSSTSSSSASSTSSTYCHKNNLPRHSLSQSSTFLPLHSAASSFYLSKLAPADYRSMQSLKLQQQQQRYSTHRSRPPPIARVSPRVVCQPLSSLPNRSPADFRHRDENWLSCEELETIEKRFNDLLQEPPEKKSIDYAQRAKSCGRLAPDDRDYQLTTSTSKLRYV